MKIKMKTVSAGPDGVFAIGDHRDVPDKEGKALVKGGFAEEVVTRAPVIEKATLPLGETATNPAATNTLDAGAADNKVDGATNTLDAGATDNKVEGGK